MVDVRENRNNGNIKKQLGISYEIPSCFFYMNVSDLYLLVEINMHSMVMLPSIHLAGMV